MRNCAGEIYSGDFIVNTIGDTITMTGECIIEGTCDIADEYTVTSQLTYINAWNGTLASDGTIDLPSFTTCGEFQPTVIISTGSQLEVMNALIELFSGWNYDFVYFDIISLVVGDNGDGTYDISFNYRCGDPFMTCGKTTCIGDSLSKQRTIDDPDVWQDIGDIDDLPYEYGTGNETLSGTCDTCNGGD